MVWIKICGITSLEDAISASLYGADALGFVFASSRREVTIDKARDIISKLPATIEKIGVFVDQDHQTVLKITRYCGLTGVQLHGDESIEYCKKLSGINVIKTFRIKNSIDYKVIAAYCADNTVSRILLDTFSDKAYGGTGQKFFQNIPLISHKIPLPLILAGGLSPENVGQALTQNRVFGLDVSSGVEEGYSIKDHAKIKKFIEQARRYDLCPA